jgi:hypothetical protein
MMRSAIKSILILLVCCGALSGSAADVIQGKVRNMTTNKPSAGDEVVLLRMGEGMEEAARTRSDEQGAFHLPVAVAGTQYVVRVIHQGVNYDQKVSQTGLLEISVFSAVPKIPGLSGSMGIVKMEAEAGSLKITEMYSITNASLPPLTQTGPRNFEFSLPEKAALDSFEAKRAGGLWVNAVPAAMAGQPGRYAVDFPLRPGDTLFKYSYHLPYAGAATLRLKVKYPIKAFAVGHPPSMSFRPLRVQAFKKLGQAQGLELEASSQPLAGTVPAFEISGLGTAPRPDAVKSALPAPLHAAIASTARSGEQSATALASAPAPVPSRDPWGKELWAVTAAIAALLAAGALGVWRRRRSASLPRMAAVDPPTPSSVDALKEELFRLENERLHGAISADEYLSLRHALIANIQRALDKRNGASAVGKPRWFKEVS